MGYGACPKFYGEGSGKGQQAEGQKSSDTLGIDVFTAWCKQLELSEICCIVFDTVPSKLWSELFWQITYDDIRTKIRIYVGQKQSHYLQEFQIFTKVVSMAFGGEKNKTNTEDVPKNLNDARMKLKRMMGKRLNRSG